METLTKQLESSALVFGVRFQNISVLHSRPLCGLVSAHGLLCQFSWRSLGRIAIIALPLSWASL